MIQTLFLLIINFFFSFYLLVLFIFGAKLIFRNRPRLLYFLSLTPLFYLPLSLLHYQFSSRTLSSIINLPKYSRHLTLFFKPLFFKIHFHTSEGYQFTPGDFLVEILWPMIIYLSVFLIIFLSLTKTIQYIFKKPEMSSPYATTRKIFIPKTMLESFPKDQLQAIFLHERAHQIWLDPICHHLIEIICRCFWFIPGITAWKRRIFLYREWACDNYARQKGVLPHSLFAAMRKIAQSEFPCSFGNTYRRAEKLSRDLTSDHLLVHLLRVFALLVIIYFLLASKIFIF